MLRLSFLALCAIGLTTLATTGCPHPPAAVGEGEGEGAAAGEGEGAVAGEGEGATAGEGEGEGTAGEGEGEGAVQTCVQNGDCPLGEICPAGTCVVGCQSARDCPGGLECDTAVGANGTCVQCTTATVATDCRNGETCVNDKCAVQCTDNTACANTNNTPVCDTTAGICVECLQNADCQLGNICLNEQCVVGCQQARDCPNNEACDTSVGNGQCVPPCATDGDCQAGTHCDVAAGFCTLGCNGNDAQCPQGDICLNNACSTSCNNATQNNCATGDHCDVASGVCVAGCAADTDCGFQAQVCDTTSGQCVQCSAAETNTCPQADPVCNTSNDTCVQCSATDSTLCTELTQQIGTTFTCDTTVDECRATCDPAVNGGRCLGSGNFNQGVCDPSDDTCVECLVDTDCPLGDTCDTTTRTCTAPAQQLGGLCGDCNSDADCGGTNQCIRLGGGTFGGGEDVCAQDCSTTGACPQGFACDFVTDVAAQDGVVTGKQCVPSDSAVQDPTCAAFRDTVAETACQVNEGGLCGDPQRQGDAVCLAATGSQDGVCTEPCNTTADCPAGFACDPVDVGQGQNSACVKQ